MMSIMNSKKSVVTSVLNLRSRILSVDRFNEDSSVYEQTIRQLEECSEPVKVTIETANKKFTIQYEQDWFMESRIN